MRLQVEGLTVRFGAFTAVDRVSLAIPAGQTLGLVGESGSGKSTVARAIVQLVRPAAGRILLDGEDVTRAAGPALRRLRTRVQMVFQDPYASLNPRMTVGEMLAEAICTHRRLGQREVGAEVDRLLELVALEPDARSRYPHQFSGGQRQRIAIARALAVGPEVLLLDEVTSSLDVSVQAGILNLIRELQRHLGLTYLFISHNLAVVRYMSDQVAVMYLGRIVEAGPTEDLFRRPRHPYTRALVDAVPTLAGVRVAHRLAGEIPDPRHPPSGCRFRTRCPYGPLRYPERRACIEEDPQGRGDVACHFPLAGDEA